MSKILKIQGVIEPPMLENLAHQIEDQDIQSGDKVDVVFDSIGGMVDVGFRIAELFEEMQDSGIEMRAVAEGKVFSTTIVPFLSIENRIALPGASFLIHKAKYEELNDLTLDKLEAYKKELEEYTEMLYDYYDDKGISREVRTHLKDGDDLTLTKKEDLMDAGFISDVVNMPSRIHNKFESIVNKAKDIIFPPTPIFSYILNSSQINQNHMTSKQVENLVAKKLEEALPAFAVAVANAVRSQEDPAAEEEPVNEATELTAEQLAGLAGRVFGTPVVVDGQDDAAMVLHFGNDLATGTPLAIANSECEIITLPDGEYAIKAGETEYPYNVAEGVGSFTPAATNEEKPEETPPTEEPPVETPPEEKPANEEEPEEEPENQKPVNKAMKSALPKPNNLKAPIAKNNHAKALHDMFAGYGPGCVGSKG